MTRSTQTLTNDQQILSSLTNRELECLLWSAVGNSSKQIAAILNISKTTVDEYIAQAKDKLGARTRAHGAKIILDLMVDYNQIRADH